MATISPLARVKEEFGGKDKLVDKIVGLIGSGDEPKDELRRRLLGAANKKLIRLHGVATQVKAAGGKDGAAAAAAAELGRGKDKDYVAKLGTYSSAKILDILQSAKRRTGRVSAAAATAAAKPAKSASKGGTAKAPAAKARRASASTAATKKKPAKK
jgi:hypothetical protein